MTMAAINTTITMTRVPHPALFDPLSVVFTLIVLRDLRVTKLLNLFPVLLYG